MRIEIQTNKQHEKAAERDVGRLGQELSEKFPTLAGWSYSFPTGVLTLEFDDLQERRLLQAASTRVADVKNEGMVLSVSIMEQEVKLEELSTTETASP